MTGSYNGCLWVTKGVCDMDPDTLECYECEAPHGKEPVSGVCSHMVLAADHAVNDRHEVSFSPIGELQTGNKMYFCKNIL